MRVNRRALLKGFAASIVAGAAGGTFVWWRFGTPHLADLSAWKGFSAADIALMNDIADVIIPTTDTPGAKAANVGSFMAVAVTDCFEPAHQSSFVAGLLAIEAESTRKFGRAFVELPSQQQVAIVSEFEGDRRWRETWNRGERGVRLLMRPIIGARPALQQVPHFLTLMKDLTIRGYFTSQVGATQALRHNAIPNDYDGNIPYRKGDRGWSM